MTSIQTTTIIIIIITIIVFPVGRIHRQLRYGEYAKHISGGAPVYLAAVLEYLVSEVMELAGDSARSSKRHRITPKNLTAAVRNDLELGEMLRNVTISQGGVVPNGKNTEIFKFQAEKARKKDEKNEIKRAD
ncbi:unnamed protein product [Caenorhabditis auriculariae]|uniref:Histone H2A n=1 Tax=Caenorhabditis auriculariae TaxID=2777116 RepID=A0A8S1H2J7_9PELO|nr:unnamed protein product [Caenorhabditis auriculariae]